MPNRPLFRSRLVAALAKRTLLASSSASLRSSAVRSGARLNINGLVYHRRNGGDAQWIPLWPAAPVRGWARLVRRRLAPWRVGVGALGAGGGAPVAGCRRGGARTGL